MQREPEAHPNTKNGNNYQEDEKKTPFAVLARGENKRRALTQQTGTILERKIRRHHMLCLLTEITIGAP